MTRPLADLIARLRSRAQTESDFPKGQMRLLMEAANALENAQQELATLRKLREEEP